jgi:hypothetical protein
MDAPQQRRLLALRGQLRPQQRQEPTTGDSGPGAGFAEGWPAHLPPPVYRRVPRYAVGDASVREHLEQHGFAVVAEVLTPAEVKSSVDKLWDFMEGMGTGIDRADISTWGNEHWMENSDPGIGLMSGHGLGHSEALWYVRGVPALKDVWATLHGTDDLIVSFDGMCQFRPWGIDPTWRTASGWFHNDRVPGPPVTPADGTHCGSSAGIHHFEYIQGFVNLVQTSESTGASVRRGVHVHALLCPLCATPWPRAWSPSTPAHRVIAKQGGCCAACVAPGGNVVAAGSHKHYAELAPQYYGEGGGGNRGVSVICVACCD